MRVRAAVICGKLACPSERVQRERHSAWALNGHASFSQITAALYPLHIHTSLVGQCALLTASTHCAKKRPYAVYPFHIHTSLAGRCAPSHWAVPLDPTILPHAVYPLHIHTCLDGACALTEGTGPVVPTTQPQAVYPLHIHTCLDGECALTLWPGPVV